jgi:hypothetical protein
MKPVPSDWAGTRVTVALHVVPEEEAPLRRRAMNLVVEMFTTESFTFCTTSTVTVRGG